MVFLGGGAFLAGAALATGFRTGAFFWTTRGLAAEAYLALRATERGLELMPYSGDSARSSACEGDSPAVCFPWSAATWE